MNWRRSEWISFSTFCTVILWIIWSSQRVKTWDIVSDPKKGNDALDNRVTILETHTADQYEEISRQLAAIYRKVK